MYKNKMIIASILMIFIFAFSTFNFFKTSELLELLHQKQEEGNKLKNLKNLKIDNLSFPKSTRKIFKTSSNSKEFVEKSADYFSLHKMLFKSKFLNGDFYKQEELELKFSCKNEQQIYKFLQHLYLNIDGFVIFEKIKIQKSDNKNFLSEIKCKIFSYSEYYKKYISIREHERSYSIKKWIHLFDYEKKEHMLNGVMQYCIAFVDNKEKRVGDEIGEYEIFKIKDNGIELLRRKDLKIIHVGENF